MLDPVRAQLSDFWLEGGPALKNKEQDLTNLPPGLWLFGSVGLCT